MIRTIVCLLLLAIPTFSQTLDRYSYRREVTIQTIKGNKVTSTLVRKSFFSFDDYGRKQETEVQVSGKSKLKLTDFDWRTLKDPPIKPKGFLLFADFGDVWTNDKYRATLWTTEQGTSSDQQRGRAWFADDEQRSGLRFPVWTEGEGIVKGKHIKLTIYYWNYRLFRTSVVVREVNEQ